MRYLLSVVQPAGQARPDPDVLATIMADVQALEQEMKDAGAWVFSGGLDYPSTATVLRPSGDDVLVIDGPYIESKEYLGGLTVVDAPDLDAALAWGRKAAQVITLPIEVRPFFEG